MTWSLHINRVPQQDKLMYWAIMYIISPYRNLPLDYHFHNVLSSVHGYGGDPGWDIDKTVGSDGTVYYDISDIEDPLYQERHTEAEFRIALRETLEEVAREFPERAKEARQVIEKWSL